MMEKDDYKEIKTISEKDVAKEMENNHLSDVEKQKFIDSIMGNYYLDNDNINFLEDNNFSFFKFKDEDLCFCLSKNTFVQCCKKNMQTKRELDYIPYEKSLLNIEDYKKYLSKNEKKFFEKYEELGKKQKCIYPDCSDLAVENCVYNFNFKNENYYSTNRPNPLDAFFKMGENFFEKVGERNFKYFGFCKTHDDEVTFEDLTNETSEQKLILNHLKALQAKLFLNKIVNFVYADDFRQNYNSIEEEGYKAIFVFRLKKLNNLIRSLEENVKLYIESLTNVGKLKIIKWELNKQKNFSILDVMYPQISPSDFNVVNTVNNPFVKDNPVTMSVAEIGKKTYVTFIYDKNNKKIYQFFYQYLLLIDNKISAKEFFASNCALILADNILFSSKYFEKLNQEEKVFLSAINKFRYENPMAGHEYVKMQFFAGFLKGNNFF